MNLLTKSISNQKGVVIVTTLFVLLILTIISISAFIDTSLELQIAANDKYYKIAFYNAESGINATLQLISQTIDNGTLPTESELGAITYIQRPSGDTSSYYRQVMGYDPYDNGIRDISFEIQDYSVELDIHRVRQEYTNGGSAEFGNQAGFGSKASVAIIYNIYSFGNGPSGASSKLTAVYRKVVGIP